MPIKLYHVQLLQRVLAPAIVQMLIGDNRSHLEARTSNASHVQTLDAEVCKIPYSAKFSRVFNLIAKIFQRKYFSENISTKIFNALHAAQRSEFAKLFLKIAVCENLDPRKFSGIYTVYLGWTYL